MCFKDTGSTKTSCFGLSLTCGVLTFAILAGLEGVLTLLNGMWVAAIPDVLLCAVGVAAVLQKDSPTMAVVNYWTWVVMDVLFAIFILILCIGG